MPRDVNGNYTLPSGNPVVTNTLISSVWANTTLSDVATGLCPIAWTAPVRVQA
jgi:hypothetical protein